MMRIAYVLLVLLCARETATVAGQDHENIARAKQYTLSPQPNYRYCTDAADKTQLTDGAYSEGYFWTQPTTVGWSSAHPAIITIDLAAVQPICGVSFNTAAGTAGVEWPVSIFILVSDDDKTYTYLGDLVGLSAKYGQPKMQGYSVHRFQTDELKARARYVKLLVGGSGAYIFVDEIEIYRGPDEFLKATLPDKKITSVAEFFREKQIVLCVKRRLKNDLAAVREALKDVQQANSLHNELARIEKEIIRIEEIQTKGFRAILPLNQLHRRIFAVQAAIWRAKGMSVLTIWQTNRWDMLSPTEPPRENGAAIDMSMMNNEYRSAAFNITNAGPGDTELGLSIVGLPGGANPNYIAVHEVPFTDTKSGVPIAAALPSAKKAGQHFRIGIPEGMTRQIWLTFHPMDMPAGEYSGKIVIKDKGIEVPIRLKIYPLTFPEQPTLHLGGWDYTDRDDRYEVTLDNVTALIKHLREHFVDTPWATSSVMPQGKYDKQGNMVEEPSTEDFRKWISRWPNVRNYYVFAAVGREFSGFEMASAAFKKAVTEWITWWVNTLAKWNIRPEQLGLLLVDEPHAHDQDRVIIEYARVIRNAQPKVVIWEDPTWQEPWKATPDLFEVSTVLCPNLVMWIGQAKEFADFYLKQREAGRILWFYSCSGPGKLLDPYSYHRMQHWFCWKYGAQGSGFWAFGDSSGASSWNEYLSQRGAYTPLFLDENSVTAGKHMEAIREGMEDYEYLRILHDRITELEASGVRSEAVQSAKKLLETAAERVTSCMTNANMIHWNQPKDRSIADTVRIEVLEKLVELR